MQLTNNPLAGKWSLDTGTSLSSSLDITYYIEFNKDGTYEVNALGIKTSGEYKITKKGDSGKVKFYPNGLDNEAFETTYSVNDGVLNLGTFGSADFKKE